MKTPETLKKFIVLVSLVLIVVIGSLVYLFSEYRAVSNILDSSRDLVEQKHFSEAVNVLENAKKLWSVKNLGFLRGRIEKEIADVRRLKEDESEYELGEAYMGNQNWKKAKEFFGRVSSSSPYFNKAKEKIDKIETEMIVEEAVSRVRKEVQEVRREAREAREKDDVSIAVARWSNYSIPVRCHWSYFDGELTRKKKGSGTIMASKDGLVEILTNRHVVTHEGNLPERCEVRFSEEGKFLDLSEYDTAYYLSKKEEDWATLNVKSLPSDTYDQIRSYVEEFDPLENSCSVEVNSGDRVVVLGYPKIGPRDKITATTGIISGKEGKFYITDAKIDEGNSGGLAVLLKQNCFLGIPTFVEKGSAESLGRILDADVILEEESEN